MHHDGHESHNGHGGHHTSPPPLPSPSVSFAVGNADGPAHGPAGPTSTPGTDGEDTHPLTWLYAVQLPTSPVLLRRAVDQYFSNVHPLRCFAFVHKPTLMRQLDDANTNGLPASDSDDMALLQIICAHGAKFCALEYSETATPQPAKLIQAAGHAWAQAAEQTLMTHYGRITVTSLMTAVLLYDYRYRLGDFAHALIMSGLTTRMAQALQLNMEYEPRTNNDEPGGRGREGGDEEAEPRGVVLSPVEKEARRRLMWACYVIDTWTGSGMDQLTLMREDDLHIQLPCNERDFLFQRAVVTGRLGVTEETESSLSSNSGMMAAYIRIVSIWKRVARYVKHLDTATLPWLPGSEFTVLDDALRTWHDGLAPDLAFSADSLYTRLASSQLGALCLLHCTYYNAMLDLYRIAMPELFSLRHAFRFPPDQNAFLHSLQTRSFQNACRMAAVLEQTAAQGARHLADSMMPMFAYNSSRVMLYYLVRLHDPARADTKTTVDETLQRVQSNNGVLHLTAAMMPLSDPLMITARRWLQKLQSGLHRQQEGAAVAALYGGGGGLGGGTTAAILPPGSTDTEIPGMADDPASGRTRGSSMLRRQLVDHHQHNVQQAGTAEPPDGNENADGSDSSVDSTDTPDNVLHPLSLFRLARKTLKDKAYSEPSSRASYAGGGLPPLRDVMIQGSSNSNGNNNMAPPSPILERLDRPSGDGGGFAMAETLPGSAISPPIAYPNSVLQPQPPSAAATPGGMALTNWENAFDDLALGLHVLQDYPHWDIHGFDHMNSVSNSNQTSSNNTAANGGGGYDNSIGGLATWPEFRKT
ncbi:hypothetical protein SBRCBS47491_005696 [Sporothrix bragantina]|uniref:Xylanolytic transcriptional activator regulatory domain-containing protein n=1 Tax=Sporothrix bragantina TaxID=671064 RepID=A0ABP0BYU0_9PEZI